MKIVTVMPFKKGVLKEEFSYFSAKNIENGDMVNIPMRNKKNLGLVISATDLLKEKADIKEMPYNLKKIDEVKENSIFLKSFIDSLFSASRYFAVKKNWIISSLMPAVMIEEYDKISKIKKLEEIISETDKKNIKKEKLLLQVPLNDRINFYKTLIRSSFADKKSVFIVLPTEKDIEDFQNVLSKGIEKFTFAIHGNLTQKKQLEKICAILKCEHPILIFGTPPFLSIPRNDFNTIILEHESSSAYKTFKKPNLDMRIFTEIYASKIGAKFILADTILRFETIARNEIEGLSEAYPLSFKTNFKGEIEIFKKNQKDISAQLETTKFQILSPKTAEEIEKTISKKKRVFVFTLRKGLATLTICRDCAEPILCKKCSAPVVLYLTKNNKRIFICNKCGTERSPETVCEKCGSWNLIPLGIGTDTVFEEIKKQFPKTHVFKLDRESVKNAKEAEKIIEEFENTSGSILIGTEMVLFYLKEKMSLSVIASFDSLWSIPNYRMSEKIIHILTAILSKTEKELIIETKNTEDEIINAVKTNNLVSFVREEIRDRRILGYPPFKRFVKISFLGNKLETANARKFLMDNFKEYNPEIFSGFVPKIKDKFATNALIKMDPANWSLPELFHHSKIDELLLEKLLSLPFAFSVSIDPEDLI